MTFRHSFTNKLRAFMNRSLTPSRRLSQGQVELAGMRVLQRLRREPMWESATPLGATAPAGNARRFSLFVVAPATAAVALAVAAGALLLWTSPDRGRAGAVVEAIDGSMYRVSDGKTYALTVGEPISLGDSVHSNGGRGGTFALADGSRVEMRSQSELSLDRADDGMRIRLSKGGIIVNAASQSTGHLYVQTRDVTVSVVGTVFLVSTEEKGSRVAVIEGEVRVQQGVREKKLRPGEQLTTNATMPSTPVQDEISWSRHAEAHLALLPQSAAPTVPAADTESRVAFEEATVRPSGPASGSGRGGASASGPCSGGYVEVDPRRFAVSDTTLFTLITMAYRMGPCPNLASAGRLTGGPPWVGSDGWDIHAIIPAGTPGYTRQQFNNGNARELQLMLRNLLAARFQLALRQETREMSTYVLRVAKDGPKLAPSKDAVSSTGMGPRIRNGQVSVGLNSNRISMEKLAGLLEAVTGGRPVVDRTGLAGEYVIDIGFVPPDLNTRLLPATGNNGLTLSGPSLFTALEEIGLVLEDARAPFDVWVIERAEKPTEN